MKKTIYSRFDKTIIPDLPQVTFPGRILVLITEHDARNAVDYLLANSTLIGMDTETRPSFKKGVQYQVSLLQVANEQVCFLFRLKYIGITEAIIRLLENTKVPMIGLSLHDDILSLHKRADFKPGNFIDIQSIAKGIGIEDLSLRKLYANIFQENIRKRQQLSNWDAESLTDKQKEYAAIDAWACIRLYKEINRLKETNDYELVVVPKPEHTTIEDDGIQEDIS